MHALSGMSVNNTNTINDYTVILMNERVRNANERRGLSVNNTIIFLMNEIECMRGVGCQ